MVKLVEEARRSRTPATQQAVAGAVDEDAGAEPANDGAAGGGGGDPAVARDPKKYCWNCKTSDSAAVKLSVCSGCKRGRYFLSDGMFTPHPCTLACSLKICTSVDRKAA